MVHQTQNILALAKQGNIEAISALISRQLQPKGIQSRISRKGNALHILLEATQAPEKSILEPFIQKGLLNIKPTSVAEVHLYGKSTQKKMPEWKSHFTIDQPPQTNMPSRRSHRASRWG